MAPSHLALPFSALDDTTALGHMRTAEARFLSLPSDAAAAVRSGVARLREQLAEARSREHDEAVTVSIADLCGRGLHRALPPLRPQAPTATRDSGATVVVTAPPTFYDRLLWPEFEALRGVLYEHFLSLAICTLDEVLVTGGDKALSIDRHDDR